MINSLKIVLMIDQLMMSYHFCKHVERSFSCLKWFLTGLLEEMVTDGDGGG